MPGEPLTQGPPGFVVRRRWSPRRDAEAAKTIFRGASHGSCVNCERCNGFDTLSAVVVSPSQLQHGRSGHVDNGVGKIHFAASSVERNAAATRGTGPVCDCAYSILLPSGARTLCTAAPPVRDWGGAGNC